MTGIPACGRAPWPKPRGLPGAAPRPGRRELPRDQMDPRLRPRRVSAGVDASRIPRCSPIGQAGGTCRGTRLRQCCGDIGKYVLLLLFCQCANSTVLHICHRSPPRRLLPPPHPLSSPTSSPGMTSAFLPPAAFSPSRRRPCRHRRGWGARLAHPVPPTWFFGLRAPPPWS